MVSSFVKTHLKGILKQREDAFSSEERPLRNGPAVVRGYGFLNREFRAVGSGAERASQRVTGTPSALRVHRPFCFGIGSRYFGARMRSTAGLNPL